MTGIDPVDVLLSAFDRARSGSPINVQVVLNGCDDLTEVYLVVDRAGLGVLEDLAAASVAASETNCQPKLAVHVLPETVSGEVEGTNE